jgi:signal peptidase I
MTTLTPSDEARENLVKRVVGLPGDTVELRGLSVSINGESVNEPYAHWAHVPVESDLSQYRWGPVVVPHDSVFVLGDNRSASRDSRAWHVPFVKLSRIQGKALIVYWSGSNVGRSGTVLR